MLCIARVIQDEDFLCWVERIQYPTGHYGPKIPPGVMYDLIDYDAQRNLMLIRVYINPELK